MADHRYLGGLRVSTSAKQGFEVVGEGLGYTGRVFECEPATGKSPPSMGIQRGE